MSYANTISAGCRTNFGIRKFASRRCLFLNNMVEFRSNGSSFPLWAIDASVIDVGKIEKCGEETDKNRFRWIKIGSDITKEQKEAISRLSPKLMNRCKALLEQIICYSSEKGELSALLSLWVRSMKPKRADWLAVLKELSKLDHPLYFEVVELALFEESFEANVRDYTKLIHGYAMQNRLQEAESALMAMKRRGFVCDQVTLTALVHMYSKAGNHKLAEDTFQAMKLLGTQLDKRSYGSMIMAYVRAGTLSQAESVLQEMEAEEVYAGREVYKALLRAYSMSGDYQGAQRVFDAIQLACIIPDPKMCALLLNAYVTGGQSHEAFLAFHNITIAGLNPNDKCVALLLSVYEKENKLNEALEFLIGLESEGIMLGKEASEILARWFKRLGVVEEVELLLREYQPYHDDPRLFRICSGRRGAATGAFG
ncbi:hypothetical protein LIER_19370 [Lithospermum erythrorhizon]|uniref:PROP1-like PPR domain-containing protein n=1 Tax=Lithospermum erythrorhizon TaxID=34254 RepID=A0AAV3QN38_LITER